VKARRFLVSGRVQGVGYRFFAVRAAKSCGVVGWVRNLPDGRVESHAEGSDEALAAFRGALEEGPAGATVWSIEAIEAEPGRGLIEFNVKL